MASSLLLVISVFATVVGCVAEEPKIVPRAIPPHVNGVSPKFFDTLYPSQGVAKLAATITSESHNRMNVLVEWEHAPDRELHTSDWIGAFDQTLLSEFHAPVKFRYVFPEKASKPLANNGSMNFSVLNLRSSYVFIYISGNQQYPELIAQSKPVTFKSISHPQATHIALSPQDPTKMLVMWTQHSPTNPMLKWGLSADKLDNSVTPTHDTYTKEDFCDTGISPAGRQGWFEPGLLMTAEVPIEAGKTYYYTCGDDADGWLPSTQNFTTPPAANSAESTRLILLADLGNAPEDGSCQHSWDFQNHGELPSRNTTRLAAHLFNKHAAHAVVHFGDIAYAVGYLSEWDEFMLQIEPVASRIPWMASIGNHEFGWSQSDPFNGTLSTASDSGGECGVAFLKRFPFAMQPLPSQTPFRQADPWYSFDIGSVHFTMLSSEHDYRTGSPQWKWMVKDLSSVDRSKTPWVGVTSHRAMYIASSWKGDLEVAELLQTHVEPQLLKYGVDFFTAGHHHSYQRFCPMNKGKCAEKGEHGIHHFVMGMAGYDHSPVAKNFTDALFTDETRWGATYWEFTKVGDQLNASMKFLDGATDEVVDQITFQKAAPAVAIVV